MSIIIPLSQGKAAVIDDGDASLVSGYRWYAVRGHETWYAQAHTYRGGRQQTVILHRLLMSPPIDKFVDHRDGDGLTNSRSNLRLATNQQNQFNQHTKRGSSRFKGVRFCPRHTNRPWEARICVDRRQRSLGSYAAEEEAAHAYDAAARAIHGEFARLNFPDDPATPVDPEYRRMAVCRLDNTSGFRGVTTRPDGRWQSSIRVNGRRRYLGTFSDSVQAAAAYDRAAREALGALAITNFPEEAA